ncbi:hypothetical protein [Novipirellula caenicola]|uniref:Uncharacterized protein n=1 Tax=Novipirellula caenicola TaxID=1536901 RepID=A0ABP9W199_9BACT
MANLVWSSDEDAWISHIESEKLGELQIRVLTDGEQSPPTDSQLRCVSVVERLAKTGLPLLTDHARKYAATYLGDTESDEMDDDELGIEFYAAVIPQLRSTTDTYIIFVGSSDIDWEHGVAVICKNALQFAVAHSDFAYSGCEWDDTSQLEQLLDG